MSDATDNRFYRERQEQRPSNQLAWLVERQENGRAVWCTANHQWTTDANEAAWFVRKVDAELFCWNLRGEATAVEHMFCSMPSAPVEPGTTPAEVIESLIRFAQHAPLCLISQWQPVDEEDFDCPDCTCGLTLLEQHGKQLAARLAPEPPPALTDRVPHDVAVRILRVRDLMANGEHDEAYHVLYGIADPTYTNFQPWAELERTAQPPAVTRDLWMAWTDQDDGWIAAIHGSSEFREHIEQRIERDVEEYGRNRFGVRPVRVTVHVGASETKSESLNRAGDNTMHAASQGGSGAGTAPHGSPSGETAPPADPAPRGFTQAEWAAMPCAGRPHDTATQFHTPDQPCPLPPGETRDSHLILDEESGAVRVDSAALARAAKATKFGGST